MSNACSRRVRSKRSDGNRGLFAHRHVGATEIQPDGTCEDLKNHSQRVRRVLRRQDHRRDGPALRRPAMPVVARVEISERLPIGIPDDVTTGYLVGASGRGEVAGFSSRAGQRRDRERPPFHRRDLQRRSLPRIDPPARGMPTWPLERVRCAAAVRYLQRDVFIKRSAVDRIPTLVARRPHYQRSSQ